MPITKNTVATPIVDANGKQTTVHKRIDKSPSSSAKRVSKAPTPTKKSGPSVTERLKSYTDELNERIKGLENDENWLNYLDSMSKFRNYSLANQILIQIQTGGKATKVAGYKTWEKLGRQVIKGEKAIAIRGFSKYNAEVKDENGNAVRDAQGNIETKTRISFPGVGVFDISQTEGDPLPTSHERMSAEPPAGLIEDIERNIRELGFDVEYKKISGTAKGSTTPTPPLVTISEDLNAAERASVLAHELAHIKAGHLERIDEYHNAHGARNSMEVEAESIGYVLLRANGMDAQANSSSTYVGGWSGVGRVGKEQWESTIQKSAELVQKVSKSILDDFEWTNFKEV